MKSQLFRLKIKNLGQPFLKAHAIVFKPPNSKLFGYRQIAINGKYLWALPTPTTFEKVDQTFIFGTETFSFAVLCYPTESQLNHNFLTL